MTAVETIPGTRTTLPWVAPFSLPIEPASEAVFDAIAGTHGTSLVRLLLERHGEAIERDNEGLVPFLAAWTNRPPTIGTVWDIAFGRVKAALTMNEPAPSDAAAGLALRLAELGEPGRWTARCSEMPAIIGGHLVPRVVSITASLNSSGEGSLLLERHGQLPTLLRRDALGKWQAEPEVLRLHRVGDTRHSMLLLPRQALPDDERTRAALAQCQAVAAVDDKMQSVFRDGLDLLQDVLPDYIPWVTRAVHGIVVCEVEAPFHLVSGSWRTYLDSSTFRARMWPSILQRSCRMRQRTSISICYSKSVRWMMARIKNYTGHRRSAETVRSAGYSWRSTRS